MPAKSEEGLELTGNDRYQGFCADLASLLAERIHISYSMVSEICVPTDRQTNRHRDIVITIFGIMVFKILVRTDRRTYRLIAIHISYTLRPVIDGKYGAETANGSWNGMVGELIRKVRYNTLLMFYSRVAL